MLGVHGSRIPPLRAIELAIIQDRACNVFLGPSFGRTRSQYSGTYGVHGFVLFFSCVVLKSFHTYICEKTRQRATAAEQKVASGAIWCSRRAVRRRKLQTSGRLLPQTMQPPVSVFTRTRAARLTGEALQYYMTGTGTCMRAYCFSQKY